MRRHTQRYISVPSLQHDILNIIIWTFFYIQFNWEQFLGHGKTSCYVSHIMSNRSLSSKLKRTKRQLSRKIWKKKWLGDSCHFCLARNPICILGEEQFLFIFCKVSFSPFYWKCQLLSGYFIVCASFAFLWLFQFLPWKEAGNLSYRIWQWLRYIKAVRLIFKHSSKVPSILLNTEQILLCSATSYL